MDRIRQGQGKRWEFLQSPGKRKWQCEGDTLELEWSDRIRQRTEWRSKAGCGSRNESSISDEQLSDLKNAVWGWRSLEEKQIWREGMCLAELGWVGHDWDIQAQSALDTWIWAGVWHGRPEQHASRSKGGGTRFCHPVKWKISIMCLFKFEAMAFQMILQNGSSTVVDLEPKLCKLRSRYKAGKWTLLTSVDGEGANRATTKASVAQSWCPHQKWFVRLWSAKGQGSFLKVLLYISSTWHVIVCYTVFVGSVGLLREPFYCSVTGKAVPSWSPSASAEMYHRLR